ncbi:MAG TPA: isochorismatase family protein [Kofleriaceae bacterium]|nr:isochorismatase family protein [Kofleriaceae bacterium]
MSAAPPSPALALSRSRAALLVVDIQERLIPAMPAEVVARVIRHTSILIDAAARLGLPIVVSQQYPKGLGGTVPAIEEALAAVGTAGAAIHRFDKLEFSAAAAPAFAALAPRLGRDQWIVAGMETHVCVYQSVRDLAARGTSVHVVADAVCSRAKSNWRIGLGLAERAGAILTATEVCVFDLLGRAGTDEFRALSKAIK